MEEMFRSSWSNTIIYVSPSWLALAGVAPTDVVLPRLLTSVALPSSEASRILVERPSVRKVRDSPKLLVGASSIESISEKQQTMLQENHESEPEMPTNSCHYLRLLATETEQSFEINKDMYHKAETDQLPMVPP